MQQSPTWPKPQLRADSPKKLIVAVAPPGVPWVITNTEVNIVTMSMARRITATAITGIRFGSEMWRKVWIGRAPSSRAASSISSSCPWRAATKMMKRKGVHCHTSATTSCARASQTLDRKSTWPSTRPTAISRSLTTRASLKASFHRKATAEGMNSIGIRNAIRQPFTQGSA